MARHHYPYIVVGYNKRRYKDTCRPNDILFDIMDMYGRVVKRIRSTGDGIRNDSMVSSYGDLVCITNVGNNSVRLLNPATGVQYPVPDRLAEEHAVHQQNIRLHPVFLVFGKVSSTGEYKALRVLGRIPDRLCSFVRPGERGVEANSPRTNKLPCR